MTMMFNRALSAAAVAGIAGVAALTAGTPAFAGAAPASPGERDDVVARTAVVDDAAPDAPGDHARRPGKSPLQVLTGARPIETIKNAKVLDNSLETT
ncbi:hypothetical protein [Streptomyces sp. NPDC049813]|uniref:hypothetical protein n=1 Tax=Streptomyces sp. NPDC049813 TaxID=3365597 RepID=UPI003797F793